MITASRTSWPVTACGVMFAILAVDFVPSAQDRDVPPSVTQKVDQLRTAIETRPRIADVIASEDARPSITRIAKGYRRAALAWQLDPVAARQLNDQQIADFVTVRAQQILTCTISLWNRVSLERGFDAQPELIKRFQAELLDGISANYRIGPDCVTLADLSGKPVVVRDAAGLNDALEFARLFDKSGSPRLLKTGMAQSATYRANASYFTQQFAAAIAEDRGFTQALQKADVIDADVRIYRFSMANVSFYIALNKQGRTQLVFVTPFSW